jgi:hypothetical protein
VSVINALDSFPPGDIVTGKNGIEVNSANSIHLFKQKKKEKPDIVFCIKCFPGLENTPDPFLPEFLGVDWFGPRQF